MWMKNVMMKSAATEVLTEDLTNTVEKISKLDEYVQGLLPKALDFGIRLVLALVFLFIGVKLIKLIRKIVKRSLEKANVDLGVIQFTDALVKVLLYLVLVLALASQFGIDTTSVIALAGSAGLAIGMALQGSLSNFAGGVLILLLKPFRVGDYIIQNGLEGTVSQIQMFYTYLLTVDNRRVVIPNGSLANNSLVNVTAQEKRQMDLEVGISYEADLKKAKDLLENMLIEDETVMHDHPRMVVVSDLADSAVILKIRFWVRPEDYWTTRWSMIEGIKLMFDENDIEIPYNKLDITVHNENA